MAQEKQAKVLVLIHSDNGGTYELAKEVAKGIERNNQVTAVIKKVNATAHHSLKNVPLAIVEELPNYDGIIFGSPVYFGNISTAMSEFLSKTVDLWKDHQLEGLPAAVFMSAGSGAGRDLAVQAFWNSLAVHGMIMVSNGIRGNEALDNSLPQGNSVLGLTSLMSLKDVERPSISERYIASLQGENFGKVAFALKDITEKPVNPDIIPKIVPREFVIPAGIDLPNVPSPAGNYLPYVRTGNLVFINQVALKDGIILNPGKLGTNLTEQQVKEATEVTMLNVIAVLKEATGGDLNRVQRCVQLTGIFNTIEGYTKHADLMNVASDLAVRFFQERGKHARATFGVSSLPLDSPVEIQAIFEIE